MSSEDLGRPLPLEAKQLGQVPSFSVIRCLTRALEGWWGSVRQHWTLKPKSRQKGQLPVALVSWVNLETQEAYC